MTVYQTTRISSNKPDRANPGINSIVETFTVGTNLVTADTIDICYVPKGAIITDVRFSSSASVGSTGNCIIGDAGDTDRFVTTKAVTAALMARLDNPVGLGYRYAARTKISLTASSIATPATGAVLFFVVEYRMDY